MSHAIEWKSIKHYLYFIRCKTFGLNYGIIAFRLGYSRSSIDVVGLQCFVITFFCHLQWEIGQNEDSYYMSMHFF